MTMPSRATRFRRLQATAVALMALAAMTVGTVPATAQAPTIPPPPVVGAVRPPIVSPGDKITISGRNFVTVKTVTMAGLSLKHKVKSRSVITATAPANAVRGTIVVATRGGVAASPRVVIVRPTLKLSPTSGPAGTVIEVSGAGFIPGEPVDLSYGRAVVANAAANRSGKLDGLEMVVPAQARPGASVVRVQGRFSGVPVDARHVVVSAWPQRGLHSTGNRQNRAEVYLGATSAPPLSLDWIANTIGPSRSSPAVVDGRVYAGADTGAVLAMPTGCASGGRRCEADALGVARGAVSSSPAVFDNALYVGSEGGSVYAFDATCTPAAGPCQPLWSYATEGPVASSPAIDGDVVVVGSDDGRLYAFDLPCEANAEDEGGCAPRWVGETGGPVRSSPAIHDGIVYAGSDDGYLYAFETTCADDGRTCRPLWRGWTGGVVRSSPAIANGTVYVGSADSKVHGFPVGCAERGAVCEAIWRGAADAPVESSPAVANGLVVVGTMAGSVMAFPVACTDRVSGCEPSWTAVTGGPVRSSPAIGGAAQGGAMVFVGSDDGFIYGYPLACRPSGSPSTCKAVWASGTSAPISASPAVVDGAVYVSSEDGTVRRWSLP